MWFFFFSYMWFLKLRDHYGRGGRKIVRDRGNWCLNENNIFWTQQDSCLYELTACTRLLMVNLDMMSAQEVEVATLSHPYGSNCWHLGFARRRASFFLRMFSCVGWPPFSGKLYIHMHLHSTNETSVFKKRKTQKWVNMEVEMELGQGGEYDQNAF